MDVALTPYPVIVSMKPQRQRAETIKHSGCPLIQICEISLRAKCSAEE